MTTLRHDHAKHRAREVDHEWRRKNPEPTTYDHEYPSNPHSHQRQNNPYHNNMLFYKTHKFYRMLGVEHDADRKRIVRQGGDLMHKCARGSEACKELRIAYEVLIDPVRRKNYNTWGDDQPATWLHVPHTAWRNRRDSNYQLPEYPTVVRDFDSRKFAKELDKLQKKKPEEKVWDLNQLARDERNRTKAMEAKQAKPRSFSVQRNKLRDTMNPYLV